MPRRRDVAVLARACAYGRALGDAAGARRLWLAGMLVAGGAILEGAGLMLLVPLLGIVTGAPPALVRWAEAHGMRLPLGCWLLAFLLLMAVRAALIRWRDLALLRLRIDFVDCLRMRLQAALARARWQFLVRLDHAGALSAVTAGLAAVNSGTYMLAQAVSALTVGLAGAVVAVALIPQLALALPLAAVLGGYLMRRRLARAAALGASSSAAQRRLLGGFADFLGGLKYIKARGMEQAHVDRLAAEHAELSRRQFDFFAAQANTRAFFELAAAAALAAFVYAAITWARLSPPGLSAAELLLVVLVLVRLLGLSKAVQGNLRQIWYMLPAFAGLERLIRRAGRAPDVAAAGKLERQGPHQSIRMNGVAFCYEPGAWVLRDIDLVLPARGLVGLVGLSGAGKTTLADLALGLLTPTRGTILIDGEVLEGERVARWKRAVGYVPQDPFLLADTVRANLRSGNPAADEARMWSALEAADAAGFVRSLPQGLDTHLGERGTRLSGGQRQRIAIARALLDEPDMLVLDEFSSQLDAAGAAQIQRTLAQLGSRLLILMITHRLAALRQADCIHVLAGGGIAQAGTWDGLAAQPGLFRELLGAIEAGERRDRG